MLKDEPLEFTGSLALCSPRANGTEEFPDGDAWTGFVETDEVPAEFVQPDGGFQTEGDGDGGLPVGSTFIRVPTDEHFMHKFGKYPGLFPENYTRVENSVKIMKKSCKKSRRLK